MPQFVPQWPYFDPSQSHPSLTHLTSDRPMMHFNHLGPSWPCHVTPCDSNVPNPVTPCTSTWWVGRLQVLEIEENLRVNISDSYETFQLESTKCVLQKNVAQVLEIICFMFLWVVYLMLIQQWCVFYIITCHYQLFLYIFMKKHLLTLLVSDATSLVSRCIFPWICSLLVFPRSNQIIKILEIFGNQQMIAKKYFRFLL